ncbi:MAG: sulfurtransferase TusA family protein [Myxococcales bacterium]|nr:sulfurtransferase TusA family protein [Myxococcales bacterium]
MTLATTATAIDCRGQRCPAPILATAKAARTLGSTGGGTLEVSADDDAFPLDIRSWCRSSGSELVELASVGGVHTAIVRVGSSSPGGSVRSSARSSAPPKLAAAPPPPPPPAPRHSEPNVVELPAVLDCRGQSCPEPILGVARRARTLGAGSQLEVIADDPAFRLDLESWCRSSGARLLSMEPEGNALRARLVLAGPGSASAPVPAARPVSVAPSDASVISLQGVAPSDRVPLLEQRAAVLRGGTTVRIVVDDTDFSVSLVQWAATAGHRLISLDARGPLEAEVQLAADPPPSTALAPVDSTALQPATADNLCTLLVLHNDREALLAALLVGVGAAAQGMDVMMFFTFWGLNLLRGDDPNPAMPKEKVSWAQRMFKWMMPRGPRQQKLGKLDMAGIGRGMLGSIMKRYELMDIPDLMAAAEEQGVRFVACTMSMQVMGITKRDLAPRNNLDFGGVAAFVESAGRSRMSLTF